MEKFNFTNVKEIKRVLDKLPEDTQVYVNGTIGALWCSEDNYVNFECADYIPDDDDELFDELMDEVRMEN